MKKLLAVLSLALLATPAAAHSYKKGDIAIGHIWARATTPGAVSGAAYVPLLNKGDTPDRLLLATSPRARQVSIHDSVLEDGVRKMRALTMLDLPPHAPVAMRPGAKHLMLVGLTQPLHEGDKFPLTLQFEKAGSVEVEVHVTAAGETAPQEDKEHEGHEGHDAAGHEGH